MSRKNKRSYDKMSISSAVVRFLIGLLLIAIVVFAGFYLLYEVDYSSRLMNSDGTYASTRAYILPPEGGAAATMPPASVTEAPVETETPAPTEAPDAVTEAPAQTEQPAETEHAGETEQPIDAEKADAKPDDSDAESGEEAVEAASVPDEAAVEETAVPEETEIPEETAPVIIITTLEPTPTPTPTPLPTPIPTPTPLPTPEPVGAKIPEAAMSAYRDDLKAPDLYEGEARIDAGISRCYLSKLNYYKAMQINGWCYIDESGFDGENCSTFALVTSKTTGKQRVYLCNNVVGGSNRNHDASEAVNASASDFQVTIDTTDFVSDEYEFQIILRFTADYKTYTFICPFATPHTFTVIEGEIVEGLPVD